MYKQCASKMSLVASIVAKTQDTGLCMGPEATVNLEFWSFL